MQLFHFDHLLKADDFENALLAGIEQAVQEKNLHLEKWPVFMPFRDTDEHSLSKLSQETGKGVAQLIYEGDMARQSYA